MTTSSLRRRLAVALAAVTMGVCSFGSAHAQEGLQPGEAFLTRFSGTAVVDGATVIDEAGIVGEALDLGAPGGPPVGARIDAEHGIEAKAGQVGQVFGVAIGDDSPPAIYLGATSAFGLHRTPDNQDWMPGMWGADGGGPGTIYVLDAADDYAPKILGDVTLDGRANSAAGLGNIAYDRSHKQLFVSDLETGMIHRIRAADGFDLGHYDHGVTARQGFFDVATDKKASLPPIAFDPASSAQISDCPSGDFSRTPSCWNYADFRRRVWGLGVRQDEATQEVRLYYSVWGSQGFGNPDYAASGDDQKNAVWSVGITEDGDFDPSDVRREFFLPDLFRSPEAIARAGLSNPVTDIAFPSIGSQNVMLLAERGGVRNLGLTAESAFAYPHEARVLRYELDKDGAWQPVGRYDVGQYDRKDDGPPYERADSAGGVSFGMGYDDSALLDPGQPNAFVWASGDELCSPAAPCFDADANAKSDVSHVDGLQGGDGALYEDVEPAQAFKPYPSPGPAYPAAGPDASYMVDADADLTRNDASRIGDVEVYQPAPVAIAQSGFVDGGLKPYPPSPVEPPYEPGWDPAPLPPDDDWWDPPPEFIDTDLAVEKTGPASCQEGVDCHYTLTIRNVGAVPYIGPLAVTDTMPVGATLSTASPGWNCVTAAPDVSCVTLGFALLPVGGVATLHLDIHLPKPVVGGVAHNCVGIDWFEMGTDDGPGDGNDFACVDTPVTPGFDLGIDKAAPPTCVEGAECLYVISVTNFGPGVFNGTLAISDALPAGVTFVAGTGCAASAGGFTCQHGGVNLAVGASDAFFVAAKLPTGIAGTSIENCADIDWSHMGADDGAPDTHADHDCASVNVLPLAGFFDLTVTKASPAHCDAGGNCVYGLVVTNNGPDDYAGGIAIHDTMPAGASYVGFTSASPWVCVAVAPNIKCVIAGPLLVHPGDTFALSLKIKLPNPIPGGATTVQNCVDLPWGSGGLPANDNPAPPFDAQDSQCVDTNIGAGFDLQIAKTGPAVCYEGHVCDYSISVTNGGPAPFNGLVAVKDALPAGATVDTASGVLTCAGLAPGTSTCGIVNGTLAPATTVTYHLNVKLPDPVAGFTVQNCASIDWSNPFPVFGASIYTGDDNSGNDGPACVTTPILAADLAPFGGTVCEKGMSCTLNVSIDNRGGHAFRGATGLRGMLLPAVHISSIKSMTEGLMCDVSGEGAYTCNADMLMLEPGTSARIQLMIDIPADFAERRIVHQKQMLWPDPAVQDAMPQDDRHVSIIHIKQPEDSKPPSCKGGEVVDGRCVCPEGTVAQTASDGGVACIKPPLVCTGGIVRGGECFCPAGAERRQTGDNSWKCVAPPPPEIICKDGRVRNGKCVCPDGTDLQQTGDNAYRCVAPPPPPEIICEDGRVRNGKCVCPAGTERQQTGDKSWKCVAPPPPEIICRGGRVRHGDCVCPDGTERQQTGNNAYKCVTPPPPEIICRGGRVRHGDCVCPDGTERQQTGDNAWKCVAPPPPEISCRGGRVRHGECFCPEGTERKQTGDSAYQCVAPAQPEISCDGGTVRRNRCLCPEGAERQQTGDNSWKCVAPERPEVTCEGGRVSRGRCTCPNGTERRQTGDNAYQCAETQQPQTNPDQPTDNNSDVPRLRRRLQVR